MVAVWRSVSAKSATLGADPVVPKPSGTVDGDLLIATGITAVGQTVTKPDASWNTAAWSLAAGAPEFWKIASGEPATYTFVASGSGTTIVSINRYDGHDPVTPFDGGSGNYVAGSGALAIPSVSPTGTDNLLAQRCVKLSNTTFTPPGTVAERYDAVEPTASVVYAGGDEVVGAGATGTRTWTPAAGTGPFVAYMVAINPVPPNDGTFSGGYDFTGSFVGQEGPAEGTFNGGYDFTGSFVGEAPGVSSGSFSGTYDFSGSFVGVAPPVPSGEGDYTPGGRDRFTARRTPKGRRRYR